MPSSKAARSAARKRPLAVTITSAAAIRACKVSAGSVSSLPSATLRSIAAVTRLASATAILALVLAAGTAGREPRAALAARSSASLAARLGEDIDLVSLLYDLIFLQFQTAVGHAFAGLHIIFHAMPRADEIHVGLGEIKTHRGLVRPQPLLDARDGEPLAGRSALVQTEIRIGVKRALVAEHADLVVADKNDAALSVLEVGKFGDEFFRHSAFAWVTARPAKAGTRSWIPACAGMSGLARTGKA